MSEVHGWVQREVVGEVRNRVLGIRCEHLGMRSEQALSKSGAGIRVGVDISIYINRRFKGLSSHFK